MPDQRQRRTRDQEAPPRPYRENKNKAKKERAEQEFIEALEMIVGGYFTELQKDRLKMVRSDLLAGRPFDTTLGRL